MSENSGTGASAARDDASGDQAEMDRRATLRRLGRLALVTAPAVTLLLDRNAKAQTVVPLSINGG